MTRIIVKQEHFEKLFLPKMSYVKSYIIAKQEQSKRLDPAHKSPKEKFVEEYTNVLISELLNKDAITDLLEQFIRQKIYSPQVNLAPDVCSYETKEGCTEVMSKYDEVKKNIEAILPSIKVSAENNQNDATQDIDLLSFMSGSIKNPIGFCNKSASLSYLETFYELCGLVGEGFSLTAFGERKNRLDKEHKNCLENEIAANSNMVNDAIDEVVSCANFIPRNLQITKDPGYSGDIVYHGCDNVDVTGRESAFNSIIEIQD